MVPTIFREEGFRFYFFSREERRLHVHVESLDGEAKFWLEPDIQLARSHGLDARGLRRIRQLIEEHEGEIRDAWYQHFGS